MKRGRQENQEYMRKWRQEHKERLKEYARKHFQEHKNWVRKHLLSINGKWVRVLKRGYPEDERCELCGRRISSHLQYHHWDDTNLSLGMWICLSCHKFAHGVEDSYLTKYVELKEEIESELAT